MTRKEFVDTVIVAVKEYIEGRDMLDSNPQIRVNPLTLDVALVNGSDFLAEIGDNDEAVESAAGADRPADEDAADYQVKQNPDFYAAGRLVAYTSEGKPAPDMKAIEDIADVYFNE